MSDDTSKDQESSSEDSSQNDEATKHLEQIESLRGEAAKSRVQRNAAMKENYAMQQVLKAHNIEFDVSKADLEGLKIDHGKVSGDFSYKAPASSGVSSPPKDTSSTNGLSLKDVDSMTLDEINENWDELAKLL